MTRRPRRLPSARSAARRARRAREGPILPPTPRMSTSPGSDARSATRAFDGRESSSSRAASSAGARPIPGAVSACSVTPVTVSSCLGDGGTRTRWLGRQGRERGPRGRRAGCARPPRRCGTRWRRRPALRKGRGRTPSAWQPVPPVAAARVGSGRPVKVARAPSVEVAAAVDPGSSRSGRSRGGGGRHGRRRRRRRRSPCRRGRGGRRGGGRGRGRRGGPGRARDRRRGATGAAGGPRRRRCRSAARLGRRVAARAATPLRTPTPVATESCVGSAPLPAGAVKVVHTTRWRRSG